MTVEESVEAVKKAETRLKRAACAFGDLIAADTDPGWSECQELEAASIEFRNACHAWAESLREIRKAVEGAGA